MQLYDPLAPKWQIRSQFAWFVVWLAVTGFGLYLTPSVHGHGTHQQLGLAPCPSVLLFDRPCPGCGLTTSWTALIHGQIGTAFKAHPLGPILYAIFSFIGLGSLWGVIRNKKLMIDTNKANLIFICTISIFFIFGVIRMAMVTHYSKTPTELFWRGQSKH